MNTLGPFISVLIIQVSLNATPSEEELIIWRGEYLTLYSPVIDDCAEVKWLTFRVTSCLSSFNHKSFIAI